MPWISRPGRKRSGERLRVGLRRWRYDHSQGMISFWIGALVVAIAMLVVMVVRSIT